jgi:hypothetical protein
MMSALQFLFMSRFFRAEMYPSASPGPIARMACSTASVSTVTMFLPGFSVHTSRSNGGPGSCAFGWASSRRTELCEVHTNCSAHSFASAHLQSRHSALHLDVSTRSEHGQLALTSSRSVSTPGKSPATSSCPSRLRADRALTTDFKPFLPSILTRRRSVSWIDEEEGASNALVYASEACTRCPRRSSARPLLVCSLTRVGSTGERKEQEMKVSIGVRA